MDSKKNLTEQEELLKEIDEEYLWEKKSVAYNKIFSFLKEQEIPGKEQTRFAKILNAYIGLELEFRRDNNRLIALIKDQINQAEQGAFTQGFELGIKLIQDNS